MGPRTCGLILQVVLKVIYHRKLPFRTKSSGLIVRGGTIHRCIGVPRFLSPRYDTDIVNRVSYRGLRNRGTPMHR